MTAKNTAYQVSFRIVTFWTEHKFTDESIKQVLKFVGSVRSIHDKAVILIVKLGLGTELAAKVFCRICNALTADNVHICRYYHDLWFHDIAMWTHWALLLLQLFVLTPNGHTKWQTATACAGKARTHTLGFRLTGTSPLFRHCCRILTSQMTRNQLPYIPVYKAIRK